jgi:hypothetical protein
MDSKYLKAMLLVAGEGIMEYDGAGEEATNGVDRVPSKKACHNTLSSTPPQFKLEKVQSDKKLPLSLLLLMK